MFEIEVLIVKAPTCLSECSSKQEVYICNASKRYYEQVSNSLASKLITSSNQMHKIYFEEYLEYSCLQALKNIMKIQGMLVFYQWLMLKDVVITFF